MSKQVIVAGWGTVDPKRRADAISKFGDLVARARKTTGCIDFAISPDARDPSRVNLFELWESAEHLNAWRKSCKRPKGAVKFVVGHMQKHEIAKSGKPF
jgi:quinol monooxygenase YgiN